MQKDSLCEKKKYKKIIDLDDVEEAEDCFDVEEDDVDVFVSGDRTTYDDSGIDDNDELYELDIDDIERENEEAEEERKKAAKEERKRIRQDNKTINYVDPVLMEKRIEEFYNTGVMTPELGLDIRKICDRLSMSARFVNYTYREEMASDAFISAYKAIYNKKFKLNSGYNPFSYITQVAFHSMVQRIKTEHKEREKTDAYRDAHFDEYMKETMAEQNAANEGSDYFDD